uniref:GRB2 associated binding protein 2 n=1 Tax=Latimeria chalumnae TaxID=7897 RepID=H3A4A7_LATCH
SAETVRSITSGTYTPRSSPADLSSTAQPLITDRTSSAPSHSSQPTLFPFDAPSSHLQTTLSASAPQDYLFLHQCMSRKTENARSASFSQATRSSFFMRSDSAVQKLTPGYSHCVNGISGQVHGFYSLPKPPKYHSEHQDSIYDLPRSFGSSNHTKPNFAGVETEDEDVYTFKTPCNTLCKELSELSMDPYNAAMTPDSVYHIPRTFTFDKNHNALTSGLGDSPAAAPPPRPPKPGQLEQKWGSPQQRPYNREKMGAASATIPRRNTLPAVENSRLHRASSCETYDYPHRVGNSIGHSVESVNDGLSSYLIKKSPLTRTDSGDSEDNYVPMNPGSSSSSFNTASAGDSHQNVYIPMSPGPQHFDFSGFSSATLPARKRPSRVSEIQPPPVNRNLKPDRKAKPTPLDLRNNTVIDELPFKSPVTRSWTRPIPTVNSVSSQRCRPVSTQSITSTDSGDSEENYVPMQNPVSASPVRSGTNSPAPRKSGNVDYLALDFQPSSPSPHRKPSTSSITSDEKVDYVQVDKEKTQALQNTMQEWTDVRQSSEPTKSTK